MFFQPRNLRGAGVGRARRTAWPSRYKRGVQIVEILKSANLTTDDKIHLHLMSAQEEKMYVFADFVYVH